MHNYTEYLVAPVLTKEEEAIILDQYIDPPCDTTHVRDWGHEKDFHIDAVEGKDSTDLPF